MSIINTNEFNKSHPLDNNILRISEKEQKVFLPYEYENVQNFSNSNTSVDEVISNKYVLPLSLFRFPNIARFRDSFAILKKECNIFESFEISLEIMFKYELYPAIIRACKNKEQLDAMLDYFDKGEMSEFEKHHFKVVFEYAPVKIKKQQREF